MRNLKLFKYLLLAVIIPVMGFGQGLVLNEGFDDITTLGGSGWQMTNQSSPLGTTGWFQGNDDVFTSKHGAPTAYIGANFNNAAKNVINATISNWLITPTRNLKNGDVLKFWTRIGDGEVNFPDRLEIRSSTGAVVLPSGPNGVGSFTTLITTINPDLDATSYPDAWTEYSITISGVGTTPVPMNFAFRYYVNDAGSGGTNGNYIGIDTVSIYSDGDCTSGTGTGSILDNGGAANPLIISFNVSGFSGAIDDVELSMTANHSWVGDLTATLEAPNGTSHVLFLRPGVPDSTHGDSSNLDGTYKFTDAATTTLWDAAISSGSIIPPGDYKTSLGVTGDATSMNATFASLANANGTWTLRVTDSGSGDTGSVTAACLKIGSSLAIGEITNKPKLSFYPNPVQDILNIKTSKAVEKIEVYDLSGKKLMNLNGQKQVNTSSLAPGTYILRVMLGKAVETVKIIKR